MIRRTLRWLFLAIVCGLLLTDASDKVCVACPPPAEAIRDGARLRLLMNELLRRRDLSLNGKSRRRPHPELSSWTNGQLLGAMNEGTFLYGSDDRQDPLFVTDRIVRGYFGSVAAVIPMAILHDHGDHWTLDKHPLSEQHICPHQRFANEPAAADCTAFVVAPNVLATAAHCFDVTGTFEIRYVIGFRRHFLAMPATFPAADVYEAESTDIHCAENEVEWALVKLKRPIAGAVVLPRTTSDTIAVGASLSMLGYPAGVPLKYATNASVRTIDGSKKTFLANLDAFHGNSGSPVFNADHRLEGLLVAGENDWTESLCGCRRPLPCRDEECRGETVVRIQNVPTEFPQNPDGRPCSQR